MSKFLRKVLTIVLVVGALFLIASCKNKPAKGDLVSVTVKLEKSEGVVHEKTYEVKEKTSAFELMKENYTLTYTESEYGAFVTAIKVAEVELKPVEANEFIAFYVNGESSMVGVSSYYIVADDILLFKIETF